LIPKKNQFVSILVALLLIGFITTSLVSYYVADDSLSNQIEETTLPLTSDNIYSEIQRDLLNPIFISSLMAQDTFVRDWVLAGEGDNESIIRYLTEIQKKYEAVTSYFVSDKTGLYYHPSGVLKEISPEDPQDFWYYRVRDLKEDYEINVDTDTVDGKSINIFINYRVYDYSGNFIGVTGVGLAVNSVKVMINKYQSRYGRQVYFINREGDITLNGDTYLDPLNIREVPGLSKLATQILTSPGFTGTYDKNGKTIYLNSRLVSEFDWYLLVEQVDDPFEKRIQKTLIINLTVSLIITFIVLFLVNLTYGGYQRKLELMATTDSLTGATNRQVFDMIFDQAVKINIRRKESLSAIMLDIDNFKDINDNFGHPAGDFVLKELSEIIISQIRVTDTLFRWGGDEFFLLLPDCDLEQAEKIAEKIRLSIKEKSIHYRNKSITLTSSFGVGMMRSGISKEESLKQIDDALYRAKKKGRNNVETQ
jgi:diguanylate cyclase (GGDEF)-like protein